MSKLFVKENEVTRANGTAGCRAYIKKEYDDGDVKMVQVLVRDYDGGLGGPYRFPKEYLVDREAGQQSAQATEWWRCSNPECLCRNGNDHNNCVACGSLRA